VKKGAMMMKIGNRNIEEDERFKHTTCGALGP